MSDQPLSGRATLVAAAVSLFQARGYHAVGVADILAHAKLPKGSLYHHFPGGKEELAAAAVAFIADEVEALLTKRFGEGLSPSAMFTEIAENTAQWLERSGFAQGALIGALAAAAGPDHPLLTAAVGQAYSRWAARFAQAEPNTQSAQTEALQKLASLEGAILLARACQDADIVRNTAREAIRP